MSDPVRDRYEGPYLDGSDLPLGTLVPVTIAAIAEPGTEKDARGKIIDKAILSFEGKAKRLILNKTNYRVLKCMFGANSKDWLGQKVHLERRYLQQAFGEQNVMCIRIIPPIGTMITRGASAFMGSVTPYE